MKKNLVAVVRYEKPLESVRQAVEMSHGLDHMPTKARVFIKPNIVFWTKAVAFPKWGVITTSRVVEDIILILKERGIDDITVGEGTVTMNPKDMETSAHAFETLGYGKLKRKYGIKYLNIFERPFKKLDLGDGVEVRFNVDALESDFVVNLPVMKAHNQTVASLGIKNLKGLIDLPSRKKCHNMTPGKDLHFWVSKLADPMPPMFTLQDGIYTNERGPGPDGKLHRTNLLVASADVLSADLVGAKILGFAPQQVPHLMHAAEHRHRPIDFSDIEVIGERIHDVARPHEYNYEYSETEDVLLPTALVKQGLKGCPPKPEDMLKALHKAGIDADPGLFEKIDTLPEFYMGRYEGKPDFDESFFRVKDDKLKAES